MRQSALEIAGFPGRFLRKRPPQPQRPPGAAADAAPTGRSAGGIAGGAFMAARARIGLSQLRWNHYPAGEGSLVGSSSRIGAWVAAGQWGFRGGRGGRFAGAAAAAAIRMENTPRARGGYSAAGPSSLRCSEKVFSPRSPQRCSFKSCSNDHMNAQGGCADSFCQGIRAAPVRANPPRGAIGAARRGRQWISGGRSVPRAGPGAVKPGRWPASGAGRVSMAGQLPAASAPAPGRFRRPVSPRGRG